MPRKLTDAEYAAKLAKIGKVEALEPYRGRKVAIKHRCLKHGEVQDATPSVLLRNCGLSCCRKEVSRANVVKLAKRAAATYRHRVDALGRVEVLEEYKGTHVPIAHKCLKHNEVHLATPSNILAGGGLACCKKAGMQKHYQKLKDEAAASYKEKIAVFGRVELVGEYIDSKKPTLHRCLVHGEVHLTKPRYVLAGSGLACCHTTTRDNYKELRSDERWANTGCRFYVARVNGKYLKPGISNKPEKRAANDKLKFYKGFEFVSPVMTRAEAWAIEQCLHLLSSDAKPDALEPEYDDFEGRTELRLKTTYPATWYIAKYHELVEELAELGWEELYLKHQRN